MWSLLSCMLTVHDTHLQEMCQHHVHIHVLLLSPTSHETQVLSAGNGAWLQRLLLCLQERLNRESKLGRVLEHLCTAGKGNMSRHVRAVDRGCTMIWLVILHGQTLSFLSHQVRVQMKGGGQMPGIVLLRRPTVHHEESDPILKEKSMIWNDTPLLVRWSSPGISIWSTCWLAWRISGTDTGIHRAWLRSVSSSFKATKLLPKRFWFI